MRCWKTSWFISATSRSRQQLTSLRTAARALPTDWSIGQKLRQPKQFPPLRRPPLVPLHQLPGWEPVP